MIRPMRSAHRPRRLWRLLIVTVYAASGLASGVHHLLGAHDGHCDACPDHAPGGVAVAPYCDGPCGDPTHHHHAPHDERHCVICQSGSWLHGGIQSAVALGHGDAATTLSPAAALPPAHRHDPGIPPARAPPRGAC